MPLPADPTICDFDGDAFFVCGDPETSFANVDCADQHDFRFPGATELCNGMDDDCDGLIDIGVDDQCDGVDDDCDGTPDDDYVVNTKELGNGT